MQYTKPFDNEKDSDFIKELKKQLPHRKELFIGRTDEEVLEKMDARAIELGEQVIKRVKISRNDPCPCGSGKKFKKCCIDKIDKYKYIQKDYDTI